MLQILVHGSKHNMTRLKSKLLSLNADKAVKTKVFSPENAKELRIPFRTEKTAKVVGKLAENPPPSSLDPDDSQLMTGVLVQNDFKMSLMAPEDLREYAGLTTTTIICKQKITLSAAGIDLIRWALEGTFGAVEELGLTKKSLTNGTSEANGNGTKHADADEELEYSPHPVAYLVMGCVTVRYQNSGEVEVEWEGNVLNDGIADAVLAVLFTVERSPAAVKRKCQFHLLSPHGPSLTDAESSKNQHHHHHHGKRNPHANVSPQERLDRLFMFLEAQFGSQVKPITQPKLAPKPVVDDDGIKAEPMDHDIEDLEAEEMERLHSIGIPVPGVEITVDKHVAKVWLETLEVECSYGVLRDRVKAVVERAVETVAPLWSQRRN